jgi:sterol desaturase/sphingolipid hydroxylase (fatty acid hydroxylase superfamily)
MRKALVSFALFVFPLAFVLLYWMHVYFEGHRIAKAIPSFVTFASLAVLILLEQFFQYEKGVSQRRLALRDIASTAVNVLVTGPVMRTLFVPLVIFLPQLLFGRNLYFASSEQLGPVWSQMILAPLLYEFLRYGIHRVQHIVPFLWELHSYHHSVTDLKTVNTYVSHPIDWALRNALPPVILAYVGFDPAAILFGAGLATTASLMSHCGAGLHAGWLNRIFVTPEVHRWHHSVKVPEGHRYSVNYGVGLVLWDWLLGTYYLPMKDGVPVQPDRLGHPDGVADEPNYFKLLFLTRYFPKSSKAARAARVQ